MTSTEHRGGDRPPLTSTGIPPSVARQRNVILAVLIALAVVGWLVFIDQARQPMGGDAMSGMSDGSTMTGPDLTMGRSAPLFFGMWVAMMAAMMFPAAAPMVVMYARIRRERSGATTVFTASYIALWFAFGGIVYLIGAAVETWVSGSEGVAMHWGRAGGVLLVLAGIYQLTPLKTSCLRHCRTPVSFVMTHWRDGTSGAIRMGLTHGLYCMGCCWLLFLILIPLGVMNVAAMVAVTLVVFAEKVMPWGRGVGRIAAIGLAVYGILVVLRPELLPTVA